MLNLALPLIRYKTLSDLFWLSVPLFFIGKMRRLNKIKSERPSTSKLCSSNLKVAHSVLGSFHKYLVPNSVSGLENTEINDTQSVHKDSQLTGEYRSTN